MAALSLWSQCRISTIVTHNLDRRAVAIADQADKAAERGFREEVCIVATRSCNTFGAPGEALVHDDGELLADPRGINVGPRQYWPAFIRGNTVAAHTHALSICGAGGAQKSRASPGPRALHTRICWCTPLGDVQTCLVPYRWPRTKAPTVQCL